MDFDDSIGKKDISHYSGGQKKKLSIAKSLCEKAHIYYMGWTTKFLR